MPVLSCVNVDKKFYNELGELEVLKNINFQLEEGEIIAILGPSGSGKTTILNIISQLIEPTEGEVITSGEIGYMFQKDQLLEWRTIWKNVILGLEIRKINDKTRYDVIKDLLTKYELIDFINNFPQELSGGMRQRIALIRTLATQPEVLLLDEPFSALDYQTRLMVSEDVYKMIRDEKISAILVTHDISEAISFCDRIIVLTKRPATIKKIHEINLTINGDRTPLKSRTAPEFREYFDLIWQELNNES